MDIVENKADGHVDPQGPVDPQGLSRAFSLTITADEIASTVDDRIASLASQIKMPGFRPGKIPASVVKIRYGKQILGEALQSLLDEGVRKVAEDSQLRLATNPELNIDDYEEGKDLKATVSFEIMPDIAPIDLAQISLTRPVVTVSEGEIEQALARIADDNKPTKPVAKPRPIKRGDTAVIDFIGRIDGVAFDGGTAQNHHLVIGGGSFLPGFEEGLIGATVGSTIEVKTTFPDQYQAQQLAGKEAVFEVTINELREAGEAKIDDALAIGLGLENLAALRKAVGEQLARAHAQATRTQVKTAVLDALDAAVGEINLPPTLVEQEYESICRAMKGNEGEGEGEARPADTQGEGHPPPDKDMSKAEKAEAQTIAKRRVKLGMLLTDIGRENTLQLSEEERNQALNREAGRYGEQAQQALEYLQKTPAAAQQVIGPIFEDKVIDFILEKAQVTDKPTTVEELYRPDGETVPQAPVSQAPVPKASKAKKAGASKSSAKKASPKAKTSAKKSATKQPK